MCIDNVSSPSPVKVIISGAGPSGLLLASLLLQRNDQASQFIPFPATTDTISSSSSSSSSPTPRYQVTLLDAAPDFGPLDPITQLHKHRSWMIGLAGHGLEALRQVPKLYNDYVRHVGVRINQVCMNVANGKWGKIASKIGDEGQADEAYIVDRNYIVAAIARFLYDTYTDHGVPKDGSGYIPRYNTKLMYVDAENKRVLARKTNPQQQPGDQLDNEELYLDYDLLVGCDGVRSVVREAIIKNHRDFEFDIGDIFHCFKAVHVRCPESVNPNAMHFLPRPFSYMNGIVLPETGGMLNISIGVARNNFDKIAPELKSDDPKVVRDFLRRNFNTFDRVDYDDFAQQWVASDWNRTAMVHCNFYHSCKLHVVLMGDAAHATSPSIGMGMNTALRDAAAFDRLLDQCHHDLQQVLLAYSQERVKEGNALTDLAFHLYCISPRHQLAEIAHTIIRGFLSTKLPFLGVQPHPQQLLGNPNYNLSQVYDLAVKQGIIPKHRYINDRIRRTFFESQTGMVAHPTKTFPSLVFVGSSLITVAAVVAYIYWL